MIAFFLLLAVFQSVVALVSGLVSHIATNLPKWRARRGRAIRAAMYGAVGAFAGGIAGYFIALAVFGKPDAAQQPDLVLPPGAPPLVAATYLVGFILGVRRGWLAGDLAPDYESNPI
jgi:MFS family permease